MGNVFTRITCRVPSRVLDSHGVFSLTLPLSTLPYSVYFRLRVYMCVRFALFRRIISTKEVPPTYTTYCVSSLRQLFYCFLLLYGFVFLSFIMQYWGLPTEF